MTIRNIILGGLALSLVSACMAPETRKHRLSDAAVEKEQQEQYRAIVRFWMDDVRRLNRIAYPILKSNYAICAQADDGGWNDGIIVSSLDSFGPELRQAARDVLNISEYPTVIHLIPGSAAAESGLVAEGDRVIAVNGDRMPASEKTLESYVKALGGLERRQGETVSYLLSRDGEEHRVALPVDASCDYRVAVLRDDTVNAFANGDALFVNTGMMRFANDYELATVIGHELAHNAMNHIEKMKSNATAGVAGGFLLDILFASVGVNTGGGFTRLGGNVGASAYSQDFETEADYVGLYFMARAGYDVNDAAVFWRRMAAQVGNARSVGKGYSHPPTAERFLRLQETAAEIERKQKAGEPLMPEIADSPS